MDQDANKRLEEIRTATEETWPQFNYEDVHFLLNLISTLREEVEVIRRRTLEEVTLKVKWWKGRPMSDDRLLKFIIDDIRALMKEGK